MSSRSPFEPTKQAERDRLLEQTQTQGFSSNYRGVRTSSTGKRFFVENVTIWNVLDEQNQMCGQAAVFSHYTPII